MLTHKKVHFNQFLMEVHVNPSIDAYTPTSHGRFCVVSLPWNTMILWKFIVKQHKIVYRDLKILHFTKIKVDHEKDKAKC
jgi:hypothetical protein